MSTLLHRLQRVAIWAAPVLYAGLIFHFSSESNPLPQLTEHVWDKALHAVEYAGLAVLLSCAWRAEGVGRGLAMTVAIAVTAIYAATDEWHQLFVPGRDSNVLDWMADAIGGVTGAALFASLTVGGRPGSDES